MSTRDIFSTISVILVLSLTVLYNVQEYCLREARAEIVELKAKLARPAEHQPITEARIKLLLATPGAIETATVGELLQMRRVVNQQSAANYALYRKLDAAVDQLVQKDMIP